MGLNDKVRSAKQEYWYRQGLQDAMETKHPNYTRFESPITSYQYGFNDGVKQRKMLKLLKNG